MAKAKQGWINMDGTDAAGRHNCQQPHILAHSGLFSPKVGATWGCKCGRVFKIESHGARLEWREVEPVEPGLDRYEVQAGDTLTGIAIRHNTDVATLAALNGITHPDQLRPRGVLIVPSTSLVALVREIEKAMPAEMLERPRDLVTYVLRHLARTGRVVLSDVPRER
jgi:hypothetical protein